MCIIMVTLYHGTDSESADMIIEKGFKNPDSIWSCSDIRKTYVVKRNDYFDDEENDYFDCSDAFYFALETAQIAAAHKDSRKTDVSIFRMQMTDEIFEDNFLPDLSCENMENCYCIDSEDLTQLIKSGQITLTRFTVFDAYNQYLRAVFLSRLSPYYIVKEPLLEDAIDKIKACAPSCEFYDMMDRCSCIEPTEIPAEYFG